MTQTPNCSKCGASLHQAALELTDEREGWRCEDAAASFVELLDFALRRDNGPALVRECWATQDSTERTGAARGAAARRTQERH